MAAEIPSRRRTRWLSIGILALGGSVGAVALLAGDRSGGVPLPDQARPDVVPSNDAADAPLLQASAHGRPQPVGARPTGQEATPCLLPEDDGAHLDDESLRRLVRDGALRDERCVQRLSAALAQRLLLWACRGDTGGPLLTEAERESVGRAWFEKQVDPAGMPSELLEAKQASVLSCVLDAVAGVPASRAHLLGVWLSGRFGTSAHAGVKQLANELARRLLARRPFTDTEWWQAFWAGLSQGSPKAFALKCAVLAVSCDTDMTTAARYIERAVAWDRAGLPEAVGVEAATFYGWAIRDVPMAGELASSLLAAEDARLQLVGMGGVPGKLRWPATLTPPLASGTLAEAVDRRLAALMGSKDMTSVMWRVSLRRQEWGIRGARSTAALLYSDLANGLDADPDAETRVLCAMGALPALDADARATEEAALVRRALREAFRASSDRVLSRVLVTLVDLMRPGRDWPSQRAQFAEWVGPRMSSLDARVQEFLAADPAPR